MVRPKVAEGSWGRFEGYDEKSKENIVTEDSVEKQEESITVEESIHRIEEASEEEIDTSNFNTLSYLQASLFSTILEDTITELRILVECNNELRIIKCKSDWGYLQRKKYGIEHTDTDADDLKNIDPDNLGCDEYKILKLDNDRKYATDAVIGTYTDLSLHKCFTALLDIVKADVEKFAYRITLAEEEANNKLLRKEGLKQLRVQRNHIKSVLYDANVKIEEWKTILEDSVLDAECKSRYITNWQRARTEQHQQTINDKEGVYSSKIEKYKQRSDHEQRVHSEVEMLMNIKINETLEEVEKWMNKYDTDMENIDLRIQIKKNDYQNMLDKRVGLEETIENHDKMMKDWNAFKEEREKIRIYRERMHNCAAIVQSWWRGLLVRKQLGPYKPKKGKGAPGGGGGAGAGGKKKK